MSFLEKPLAQDEVLSLAGKALGQAGERTVQRQADDDVREVSDGGLVVGRSPDMLALFEMIAHVAGSDANILILGEHGTGKEVVANAIHVRSPRARHPFIKINCAAIPRDLIESELCGYRKGAFTGATADKVGLLELADGGSLLLDEIGEMPAYLQTKLLRILQEREFRPIGSDRVVKVDFRLICATNVAIETALRDGKLREDLYFRINTITLTVPPLRDRIDDVPLLAEAFLQKFSQRHGRPARAISSLGLALLKRAAWPGNVRELENVIERAVLVCRTAEIGPDDLPEYLKGAAAPEAFSIPPHRTLAEIERMAILQTLERTNWNKQEAAQMLGLYRPTLYSKMRKHRITDLRSTRGTKTTVDTR
jgi:DNA-binding NtrC family response regulator